MPNASGHLFPTGIDSDNYFELMIRNAWHISGGTGQCANTTCRRVLVIHFDGHQTVEEIKVWQGGVRQGRGALVGLQWLIIIHM